MTAESRAPDARLADSPTNFFMTIRDIAFWVRSARADARLNRFRGDHASGPAFDQLYSQVEDPFGSELPQFRYQRRKYDSLLSMLPRRPYARALDIGCGLGSLTRRLAPFTGQIHGTDISAVAIDQARRLSASLPNVTYANEDVLGGSATSESGFDLIVLADILYYLDPLTEAKLKSIARLVSSKLSRGGLLLIVNHYFFGVDSASRGTRRIHDAFRWAPTLTLTAEYRRAFYLATILQQSDI